MSTTAMKTEIAIVSNTRGTVRSLLVSSGASVAPGQVVAFIQTAD